MMINNYINSSIVKLYKFIWGAWKTNNYFILIFTEKTTLNYNQLTNK